VSHVDRRHQILEVSLTAFSARGYHNTSMNDIAESMSLTKPVLYQYFDSKRSLYLELLRHVGAQLVGEVTSAVSGTSDPREQTERGMVAYFTWVHNNREAFALLFESSARVDEEFADIVSEFEDAAARAIAPFIAVDASEDNLYTFAIGLVGMAEAVSRQVIHHGRTFQPEELGRAVAGLAWAGLRSLGQSRSDQPR
jgi:AcrR family transcriptional regulator